MGCIITNGFLDAISLVEKFPLAGHGKLSPDILMIEGNAESGAIYGIVLRLVFDVR